MPAPIPADLSRIPSGRVPIRLDAGLTRQLPPDYITPTPSDATASIGPDTRPPWDVTRDWIGEKLEPLTPKAKGFPSITAEDIANGNFAALLPGVDPETGESIRSLRTPGYEAPLAAKIGAGVERGVARTADVLAPWVIGGPVLGAATRAPLAGRAVSAVFAAQMAGGLPDTAKAFINAVENNDVQGAVETAVGGTLGAYFTYKAGQHALGRQQVPMTKMVDYNPQQVSEAFDRVNRGEGTPTDEAVAQFMGQFAQPLEAAGKGIKIPLPVLDESGEPQMRYVGLAEESPAIRRLLTKQITTEFTPDQIKDIYARVNTDQATPPEQELVRFINQAFEAPGEAVRKGVKVSTGEPRIESQFWRDYLGLKPGETTIELLRGGKKGTYASRKQSSVAQIGSQEAIGVSEARGGTGPPLPPIAGTGETAQRPFIAPPVVAPGSAPPELMEPKERHSAPNPQQDAAVADESNDSIVGRTNVGDERDKAFAERAKAATRLANTLRPGDKIVENDGTINTVESNLGNGVFHTEEGGVGVNLAILFIPHDANLTVGEGGRIMAGTTIPAAKIVRGNSAKDIHTQYAEASGHRKELRQAITDRKPVNTEAADAYGMQKSLAKNGYVREGDRYVFKATTAPAGQAVPDLTAVVGHLTMLAPDQFRAWRDGIGAGLPAMQQQLATIAPDALRNALAIATEQATQAQAQSRANPNGQTLQAYQDAAGKVQFFNETLAFAKPKATAPPKIPKSSTQLTLPNQHALPFHQFAQSIPDSEVYHKADETGKEDFGIETEPHITVLYGLTEHEPSAVAKIAAGSKPITVTLGKLSVFEQPDYDVLKVDVHGDDLRALNKEISKLPNEQTHPEYTPHLTIAYLKKGEGKKYVGDKRFNGMTLTFPSVTFSPPKEIRAVTGRHELPFTPPAKPAAKEPTGRSLRRGLIDVERQTKALQAERIQINRLLDEMQRRRDIGEYPLPSREAEDRLKQRLKVVEEQLFAQAKRPPAPTPSVALEPERAAADLTDFSDAEIESLLSAPEPATQKPPQPHKPAPSIPRPKAARKPPTAKESLGGAAKDLKDAMEEGMKGLDELFGGGTHVGALGPTFSEETYQKAKPHFKKAYEDCVNAGGKMSDFINAVLARFKKFGDAIKPYLKRFLQELRDGKIEINLKGKDESERQAGKRPLVPKPPGVAEGQSPGTVEGEAEGTVQGGGSGGAGGTPGSPSSPGKGRSVRPRDGGGAKRTTAGGEPAGEPDPDERPGVSEGAGDAEVRRGKDVAPTDNLRIQPGDKIVPDARSGRIQANLAAWALSKRLAAGDMLPTPSEKRILAQFSGWGDTFQVFGLTQINAHNTAADVYDEEKAGHQAYYILHNPKERESYEKWKKQYAAAYDTLKASLTPEEWKSASESSLNAHYTSRDGINAMWQIVERLGWPGGTAVETSAGIGHIIGLTPDALAGKVHWVGVELDKMSAQMLGQLYPASDIQNSAFEKSLRTENNSANLAISNFPFGDYPIADIAHPDYDGWSIHNYFLARSVDMVKPGGLVVAITSRYTMDGSDGQKMRRWLAERADMVGAIRLPNTAFKASAGTEVVTDILIFRKKAGIGNLVGERFTALANVEIPAANRAAQREGESPAEYQERISKPVMVNEYFAEHPEMVLGQHSTKGTMYSKDSYTVSPKTDKPLKAQLEEAVATLPQNIIHAEQDRIEAEDTGESLRTIKGRKTDSYVFEDGKVWQVDDQGRMQTPDWGESAAQAAKARQLIGLRDATLNQINLELDENSDDAALTAARKELNKLFDSFTAKHGALNDRKNNLIDDDPEWPLVASLEDERSDPVEIERGGRKVIRFVASYSKGPMLLRRVNFPHSEPAKADNLSDAVSISINYRGGIDAEYVGRMLAIPTEEARQRVLTEELAYENPANGLLEQPDLYLSGFVKEKLGAARRAQTTDDRFSRNVAALEKVQPKPLPADIIYFRLGSNWIASNQIQRFLRDVLEVDSSVMFVRAGDETRWIVGDPSRSSVANLSNYSAGGVAGHKLVEDSLNLKLTEVTDKIELLDVNGKPYEKTVVLPEETAAARDMQDRIQQAFRRWALESPQEAGEVEEVYNRLFNGMVRREYPVPKFDRFPGASNMVDLRDWQKRVAARAVQEGTLMAHAVGTGKTFSLITAAMEMRRLGTARKPLIVAKNATLTQFANSFRKLYPTARLLIGNSKATAAEKRNRFIARIATGDWDAVVVPTSFFERIDNDPAREQAYVHEQLAAIETAIREAEGENYTPGKKPKSTLGKALMRVLKRYEAKMDRIMQRLDKKSDDLITFEKLGVDALLVDESHDFKRGDFMTKMDRIKGLDSNGSDRAMDFLLKTQWIHMKSPDRNVVLATGTPISNTLAELWTALRYVRPGLLAKFNVSTFDDFVGTFAIPVATIEETPTGDFAQVLRLAKYVNGPEIGQLWRAGADVYVLNREDFKALGVNVPEIKGGAPREVVLERSEATGNFVDFLRDWRLWWEDLDGKDKAELSYVPILQYGLARKAAIDLRLVNPMLPDDPASKVNRVVNDAYNFWRDTKESSGTQLIFSNLQNSHDPDKRWLKEDLHLANPLYGKPVFNVFDDMRKKLVALGVPSGEIADFTNMTEPQRFSSMEQVQAGRIRIVFGSTESLGTGVNVQDHVVAVHHIDPQFRPMDFEQRNGRAIRQGNQNKEVELLVYGVKRTMDSTLYQLMLIKQKFIAQVMTADNLSREFEDPSDDSTMSFQAMAAAFSGNPVFAQRFALENEVRKLSILEEDWGRKRSDGRTELRTVQEGKAKFDDTVDVLRKAQAALTKAFSGDEFAVIYKDQSAAGDDGKKLLDKVLADAIAEMQTNLKEEFDAGELHQSHAKDIDAHKKRKFPEDYLLSLPTRERTRRFSINGVEFVIKLSQPSEIPLVKEKGALNLREPNGWWELKGHNTADWSPDKPWYNSVNEIHGHATTGSGLQTSLGHAIKVMGERLTTVDASRKRFDKVESDLKRELSKPFESANRLVEQRQKLEEVLAQLAASGAAVGQQAAPTMDEIVRKYPQLAYLTRQVQAEGNAELVAKFNAEDREKAKNAFYRRVSSGGFEIVKNARPVKLKGFEWMDAFVWQEKDTLKWRIADGATGMGMGSGDTADATKAKAEESLAANGEEQVRRVLRNAALNTGLTPRAKARDGENASIFSKFQEGALVVLERDKDRYIGPIKQINLDTGELVMEVNGNSVVVPARFVQLASKEEQAKWIEDRKVDPEGAASLTESEAQPSGPLNPERAAAVVQAWRKEIPNAPDVDIVNDPGMTRIGSDGLPYGVKALWDGQKIIVNLAFLPDEAALRGALEHELVHPLMDSPEGLQAIDEAIAAELGKDELDNLRRRYKQGASEAEDQYRRRIYAEWFARLKERSLSAWQRIIAAIRKFLAKLKLVKLTDEEIGRAILSRLQADARGPSGLQEGMASLGGALYQFYSRLTRTVEQSQQGKATGAQWKATIRNSKLGANMDEFALVGVNDLEDGKSYTKQEVLDYLRANEVVVKDVTLGGFNRTGFRVERGRQTTDPADQTWDVYDKDGRYLTSGLSEDGAWRALKEYVTRGRARIKELQAKWRDAGSGGLARSERAELTDLVNSDIEHAASDPTHFAQYQLPGSKEGSYREILLTVPERVGSVDWQNSGPIRLNLEVSGGGSRVVDSQQWKANINGADYTITYNPNVAAKYRLDGEKGGLQNARFGSLEEAKLRAQEGTNYKYSGRMTWRDGHSQYSAIANPIVRIRLNERTTSDGKKILFLEEVQPPQKGEFEKMPALFQKNWREIAFKWALQKAASEGYDSLGWTTGEQQAARYDLSEQVDNVIALRWADGWTIAVTGKDGKRFQPQEKQYKTESELAELVGKDLAAKIVKEVVTPYSEKEYSGIDLKVGGEGLKKLYGVDFRNVVNNLPAVKKSGQKVGTAEITVAPKRVFVRDEVNSIVLRKDVLNKVELIRSVWEMPGRTAEGWQNWNTALDQQADNVLSEMGHGSSYDKSIEQFGSQGLADKLGFGGTFDRESTTSPIHSLSITPQIRESVMGGQALFSLTGKPIRGHASLTDEPVQGMDVEEFEREIDQTLADEEGVPTVVMGHKDTVRGKPRLNQAAGVAMAKQVFDDAGLTVVARTDGFWQLADPTTSQEAAGQALLAKLKELNADPNSELFSAPGGAGGNLLNSVVVYMTGDDLQAFSAGLKRELYKAAQSERSHRGTMLAALRGGKQSVEYVAKHVDVMLNAQYAKEFGGPDIERVIKAGLEDFRGQFTDEELENALKDAPAFADLLKKLTGNNALEFLRRVFQLPFSQRRELRANAERLAVETLNVTPEMARTLGKEFEKTFDTMFDRATTHALSVLEKMLSAAERRRLGVGRRSGAWVKIVAAVKAGKFDAGYVLQRIAEAGGYTIPSEAEIAKVREMAERLDKLRKLPPEIAAAAGKDQAALRAAYRKFSAGTSERQTSLQRDIGTYWAKWTRPFTLRSGQGRANIVEGIYEFASANILAKIGFLTRQSFDVGPTAVMHIPFRSFANALVQHGGFRGASTAEFWQDANRLLRESVTGQSQALRAALREFREALKGTAEIKNVDRLLSGIALFERVGLKADELAAKGQPAQAFVLRLFGAIRFSYRFASAWDNLQGVPQEWQEIRSEAYREFRQRGMSPAEAAVAVDRIMPDVKADYLRAVEEARRYYELSEPDHAPSKSEIETGAWHILKGMAYQRMREAGMPADEYEQKNRLMRSTNAWNESMTGVVSPGGIISSTIKQFGELGKNVPIPFGALAAAFGRFGNAIGIGVDRALMYPLGFFPAAFGVPSKYIDPETGIASRGNPFMRTAEDRAQRKVEATVFSSIGLLIALLIMGGMVVYRGRWPRDKEERDIWDANGWRPGTAAIQLGDGKEIVVSTTVGPFAPLRPYMAAAGALVDAQTRKAKQQAALDAKAAKLGLAPGAVPRLDIADMLGIAAETAWAAALGGRTAGGLLGSLTDQGTFNASKSLAATVSPLVPGLPGIQEATRLAGVTLDNRTATVLDFMLPLPTSKAAKVNMLGDPAGNQNDVQRIVQILTGGTYPGITDTQAGKAREGYAALFNTGYRPPSIDPGKGYAFADAYRTMTDAELERYSTLRGQYFKAELAGIGPDADVKAVRQAFQTANARALGELGVSQPTSAAQSQQGAPRSAQGTGFGAGVGRLAFGGRVGLGRSLRRTGRSIGRRSSRLARGPSLRSARSLRLGSRFGRNRALTVR